MKKAVYLIAAIIMISCSPCKKIIKHPECIKIDTIKIETIRTEKDSIETIKIDSSFLDLYFECDEEQVVLLKEINDIKKSRIKTVIKLKDNTLHLRSYIDSLDILHKIIIEEKSRSKTILNPINDQLQNVNKQLELKIVKLKERNKVLLIGVFILILIILIYNLYLIKKNKV